MFFGQTKTCLFLGWPNPSRPNQPKRDMFWFGRQSILLLFIRYGVSRTTFFDVGVVARVRNPHTSYINTTWACGLHAIMRCALDRYCVVYGGKEEEGRASYQHLLRFFSAKSI